MTKRHFFGLGTVLFLLATAFAIQGPQATGLVPKAGATCSKLGQTIDYQGKRFTCIKSGSKRVWDKGVTIRLSPTPKPTLSPSTTPTPSPSQTLTSATPSSSPVASASSTPAKTATPTPTSTVREYTAAEVRTHNTASSCWSIINGDVYNLTTWIGQHPGGAAAIASLCGVDGTRSFNSQHEGSGKVMRQLSQFNIGRLKG